MIAIERDERCLAALAEIAAHWPGRLQVIAGDALTVAPSQLVAAAGGLPIRICANLPYNVGDGAADALAGEPSLGRPSMIG